MPATIALPSHRMRAMRMNTCFAALLAVSENATDDDARGAALWALGRVDLGPFGDRAQKAAAAAVGTAVVGGAIYEYTRHRRSQ